MNQPQVILNGDAHARPQPWNCEINDTHVAEGAGTEKQLTQEGTDSIVHHPIACFQKPAEVRNHRHNNSLMSTQPSSLSSHRASEQAVRKPYIPSRRGGIRCCEVHERLDALTLLAV